MRPYSIKRKQDALWHLIALGTLTKAHRPDGWSPDDICKPARVAMIDTSVAMDHPNLSAAIRRDLAFDLFSTRLGAFPGLPEQKEIGDLGLGDAQALVAGLPGCKALLCELMARLAPDQPPQMGTLQPAASPVFSGHGTAIAGLIGARPARVPYSQAHIDGPADGQLPLPYCGADPTCEIVPISTNFDADPEQMILAFLYAELVRADVIVLPRGIEDPFRTAPQLHAIDFLGQPLGELTAPCPIPEAQRELWSELAELILKISHRRPVICAAGNAHEEFGIYPANLASEDNGVISVGALNAKGWPSSYSPEEGLTVWAPSNDSEQFDSGEVRLNPERLAEIRYGVPPVNDNHKYSAFGIISTDVPGPGGYVATPFDMPEREEGLWEYGSYFCDFGGTSAACAIVAGFMALGRGLGQIPADADGIAAKAWLLSKCQPVRPELPNVMVPHLHAMPFEPSDPDEPDEP
ncbi:S8/S53 family peptidase [Natronohydrobacter thiooxidans]|uniref:S8/S53 family peptidase n=1 Tax=Natronohydrobacter thiooxidans TaxID=87172 RepID=UPI000A46FBC7|nr:S8/S53 family peptidase [Natronohydrobacter thiooxidans]